MRFNSSILKEPARSKSWLPSGENYLKGILFYFLSLSPQYLFRGTGSSTGKEAFANLYLDVLSVVKLLIFRRKGQT